MGHYAFTLFDSGSTHSFIYFSFVRQVGFELEPLLHVLSIIDLVSKDRVKDG